MSDQVPQFNQQAPDDSKVAIIAAQYNAVISDALAIAAVDTLITLGVARDNILQHRVPGAFELPSAALWVGRYQRIDAIIAVGTVIRGDTPHFDYVCGACAQGLMQVGVTLELPVIFGVLTTDNQTQAQARTTPHNNKGAEAARAAIEMMRLKRAIQNQHGR